MIPFRIREGRILTVSAPTKEIEIKPLPISNRPSNFSGAIGSFQAIASVDTNK